jgi:hypothetical protein
VYVLSDECRLLQVKLITWKLKRLHYNINIHHSESIYSGRWVEFAADNVIQQASVLVVLNLVRSLVSDTYNKMQ